MKFLIVKLSSLGDILQAFPVAESLKSRFPNCTVDWVVEQKGKDLVERHPLINDVYVVDRSQLLKSRKPLKTAHYDKIFDLQGNCKSALYTSAAKSPLKVGFGWKSVPEWPNLLVTHQKIDPPEGRNRREDYLVLAGVSVPSPSNGILLNLSEAEHLSIKPYLKKKALIAHGSMWESKKLSKEAWVELLKDLQGELLIAWGSPKEKEEAEWMQSRLSNATVLPKFNLPCLQHIMNSAEMVLSVDSLALHLAGTTKTPTFSIFGPSSSAKYAPIGDHHQSYTGTCSYGMTFERRCPKLRTCSDAPCMKAISPNTLLQEFKVFLKRL